MVHVDLSYMSEPIYHIFNILLTFQANVMEMLYFSLSLDENNDVYSYSGSS